MIVSFTMFFNYILKLDASQPSLSFSTCNVKHGPSNCDTKLFSLLLTRKEPSKKRGKGEGGGGGGGVGVN